MQSDQQGIILQHIKTTQAAQYQKQLHQKKWTQEMDISSKTNRWAKGTLKDAQYH